MQTRPDEDSSLNDLEDRFAVIERRIQELLDRNRALGVRVVELEQELAGMRDASREMEQLQAAKLRLREKLGAILQNLESVTGKKQQGAPE